MNLSEVSDEELISLYYSTKEKIQEADTRQYTKKISINSIYGAVANTVMNIANSDLAGGITSYGRYNLKKTSQNIVKKINEMNPKFNVSICQGDTDSVVGDTIVSTTKFGEQKIEDLFDLYSGVIEYRNENNLIKHIMDDDFSKSMSKDFVVQNKKINYIMKHKVNKTMYKIKASGKEVIITEDHSVMVKRNGELISVKASEIKKPDKLITYTPNQNYFEYLKYPNFEIENLGKKEEWVYDIEVEDNHNFFANDILVHNSFYISLETVVNEFINSKPNASTADIVEFLDQFCKKVISPKIQEIASSIAKECNAREDEILWEREAISSVFLSTGRKRYACLLLDDEGTRLSTPKKKVVGLEIKRSSTPADVRKSLETVLDLIFAGDNTALVNFIEDYKKNYGKINIDEIAIPTGVSELDKFIEDSSLTLPWHVRASIVYNNYITSSGLDYPLIVAGDKIKVVYLRKNPITNSDTMAYLDPRFLHESGLIKYIDFNLMFQKSFMSPVEKLTQIVGWKTSLNDTLMELF